MQDDIGETGRNLFEDYEYYESKSCHRNISEKCYGLNSGIARGYDAQFNLEEKWHLTPGGGKRLK